MTLEHNLAEQAALAEAIRDGETSRGALMGRDDLLAEECVIRLEEIERDRYLNFLESKAQYSGGDGFEPTFMPAALFDFQRYVVDWNQRMGRSADFLDCGMGKTPIQLTWAENVVRHTNKPVLVITPLAVSGQTIREAEKFGIDARRSQDGTLPHRGIVVTNYERLTKFNPDDFAGAVCDESSILKSFDGARKQEITEFMRRMRYRLLCTATAAPNDYIELGTSSEALGHLGYTDMLQRFFKNDQNTVKPMRSGRFGGEYSGTEPEKRTDKWRFKGHAEEAFWRWICSFTRSARNPADLGFPGESARFRLPTLTETEHIVAPLRLADGMLFSLPAIGLKEQREERSRTVEERCAKVAKLVGALNEQVMVWCLLNTEGDLLAKIPGSVQVSGKDSDESKEEKFLAFASGEIRILVTKPKIGAWGLNFQNCHRITSFPSHSFEQYYQAVRRCWRFGQEHPVHVDIVTTEGEVGVRDSMTRKAAQASKMFDRIVANMHQAISVDKGRSFGQKEEVPIWL